MTSMIIARTGRCLAAGAALVAFALGASATAGAAPAFDQQAVIDCVKAIPSSDKDYTYKFHQCCQDNGGVPTQTPDTLSCGAPAVLSNPTGKTPPPKPPVIMRPAPGSTSVG
jgi:hypothetical protein